jgi:hypothetical protein
MTGLLLLPNLQSTPSFEVHHIRDCRRADIYLSAATQSKFNADVSIMTMHHRFKLLPIPRINSSERNNPNPNMTIVPLKAPGLFFVVHSLLLQ